MNRQIYKKFRRDESTINNIQFYTNFCLLFLVDGSVSVPIGGSSIFIVGFSWPGLASWGVVRIGREMKLLDFRLATIGSVESLRGQCQQLRDLLPRPAPCFLANNKGDALQEGLGFEVLSQAENVHQLLDAQLIRLRILFPR